MPGGVAAEVRQWILDTPPVTLHAKRSAQGDEGWRVAVTESRREGIGGMVLVKGVVDGGREVRICLPGAGAGKGRGVGGVREGCVVAIKGVTWDMELDGEVWVVTTEWTALRADG